MKIFQLLQSLLHEIYTRTWFSSKCSIRHKYIKFFLSLANDQLDAQIVLTHLLQSSTCFEQHLAHPQEVKWY